MAHEERYQRGLWSQDEPQQNGLWSQHESAPELPFVIDNQQYYMSEVLTRLLQRHKGQALDIATAYFNVGGWNLLTPAITQLGNLRLLIGDELTTGEDIGIQEKGEKPIKGLIRELSEESFNEKTLRLIEELIAFLSEERVQIRNYTKSFLHAKCYLFYGDSDYLRFSPQTAIVGSSNLTRAGLFTSRELNLMHRATLTEQEVDPQRMLTLIPKSERQELNAQTSEQRIRAANIPGLLAMHQLNAWYEQCWSEASDFKAELIELLNASKFGRKAYTPFQIYMKAIFEYFRNELESENNINNGTRSTIELSEFQEDAVQKARRILERYDGVMIADSVGLGKTWIGKKLLEDYAYHRRYKALVICPAALQKMWHDELYSSGISAHIITQESLGRDSFDSYGFTDADIILIDESHNFRNHTTHRYENLERLLAANQRRGANSGTRKKLILLTATPINNSVFDLYNQINLFTGGDLSYFANAGIGDLKSYFVAARRNTQQQDSSIALFNLLEEVVVRRTRPFIKKTYPNATIKGEPIRWPERKLRTIRYQLEDTYEGIYNQIVDQIESLRLAPYRLESYKRKGIERDTFEEGREEALAGIFKSRYLKRFESSIAAFRISIRRALEFLETFESYIAADKVLDSANFQKALRFLEREDEEDDATSPDSRADEIDAHEEAHQFIDALPKLDAAQYQLKRLKHDLSKDVAALREIWQHISVITPVNDAKLNQLKALLAGDLKGKKVLIFTYYKDTARYLTQQLCSDDPATNAWRRSCGNPTIRRMDSSADTRERARIVSCFAPRANQHEDICGSEQEIDILISTDVLSEGQNLQDCGILINYDLHWNPTRMIQRAGRIDRLGTSFETLWVMNMFPDDGLERLLGLVESLSLKISEIDRNGLLDASILGEVVHPQNFNTLQRIEDEDNSVVEEQEQFTELVSSEYLLQNLKDLLDKGMQQSLEILPDGIHSGLTHAGARGVFFYFTTKEKKPRQNGRNGQSENSAESSSSKRQHFWRYIDLKETLLGGEIEENRYLITNLIHCQPETPRSMPFSDDINIFSLQEKVIDSILRHAARQVAREEAPRQLDSTQQAVMQLLNAYLTRSIDKRAEIIEALQRLQAPQPRVYLKSLKKAYELFKRNGQIDDLLQTARNIGEISEPKGKESPEPARSSSLKRDDLKLICFEYIW
jgi:ERCC4-like helicases